MLDAHQTDHFQRHGFVILPGFVEADTLSAWRDQFWQHVSADRDDPSSWPSDYVVKDFAVEPRLGDLPQITAIVQQLGGGMFAGGGGSMLVQWPKPEAEWKAPATGHIDGYGPGGWSGGFMLAATTYLEDVEPHGGSFYYWPDSHLPMHDYFRAHPEQIDGSFRERDDWEARTWGIFSDPCPSDPVEFTGAAGDLILWHCYLCHTGSPNVNARPRQGVFSRWHRSDREEMKWDVGGDDLWKYWAI